MIYAGGRFDVKEPYFEDASRDYARTMFGENIDFKRAAYWYTLAAKQGDCAAMCNLGIAYKEGAGVEQDLVKATELIKKLQSREILMLNFLMEIC